MIIPNDKFFGGAQKTPAPVRFGHDGEWFSLIADRLHGRLCEQNTSDDCTYDSQSGYLLWRNRGKFGPTLGNMTCGHFDLMGICLSCVVTVVSLLMSQNSEFKFEGSINLLVIRLI